MRILNKMIFKIERFKESERLEEEIKENLERVGWRIK